MFPGVDGFHWSPAHITFLTVFGIVLMAIGTTMLIVLWRTLRDVRSGRGARIRWTEDFEDLPVNERLCRHALSGTAPGRVCPRALDCRECAEHPVYAAREISASAGIPCGLDYPAQRYYHRGHTWVEPLEDGCFAIGMDDLAQRIAGPIDQVRLPAPGETLHANGAAFTVSSRGRRLRLRAPMDGRVVATGGADQPWLVKVKPLEASPRLTHLLHGAEVSAWVRTELERLQVLVSPDATGPVLADGGMLHRDLPGAMPSAPWDEIAGAMLLEP
ncbi:MAG: hypothetical protein IT161_00105 [Bryobacterales bacterium]|nr:hypothetical protein [Bryobacterales bacterium]